MSYFAKHSLTGVIAEYPDHYREHPVLSKVLIEVPKPTRGCDDCGVPVVSEEPVSVEEPEQSWVYQGDDYPVYDTPGKD